MDTYNNAIMILSKSCAITETSYPFGRLRDGRQSTNYMHMNSITRHKDGFLVMCHNETIKTGRNSEIAVLDEKLDLIQLVNTMRPVLMTFNFTAKMIYLNSLGGNIVHGDKKIIQNGASSKALLFVTRTSYTVTTNIQLEAIGLALFQRLCL